MFISYSHFYNVMECREIIMSNVLVRPCSRPALKLLKKNWLSLKYLLKNFH